MTRKEEIRQASIEYTLKNRPKCIGGDSFAEMADELNRNPAFEEGAKWADNNPLQDIVNLNDVWHDANEKPNGPYIVLCDGLDNLQWVENYQHIDMSYANWKNYADAFNINRWAYIKDLLPKN